MRHRKNTNHFGRTAEHRAAMVRNLVLNLLRHERIRTTIQKAKAARPLAEKVITWGKRGDLHARRLALKALGGNKPAVQKIFSRLSKRYAERTGGYTRIVKLPETIRLTKDESLGRREEGSVGAAAAWPQRGSETFHEAHQAQREFRRVSESAPAQGEAGVSPFL